MLFISVNRALFLWFLMIVGLSLPMGGHAQQADTERDHKYSPCSPSKYPDNMTMVVQVMCGGQLLSDYEIAVFDAAGECRESSFSRPESAGRCYLTIPGDVDSGSLTFRVVSQMDGSEYDVEALESIVFQVDEHVGSLNAPFLLNIPPPTSIRPSLVSSLQVTVQSGGLYLECSQPITVNITSLGGLKQVLTFQGSCFVALPVGVYLVAGKKYLIV